MYNISFSETNMCRQRLGWVMRRPVLITLFLVLGVILYASRLDRNFDHVKNTKQISESENKTTEAENMNINTWVVSKLKELDNLLDEMRGMKQLLSKVNAVNVRSTDTSKNHSDDDKLTFYPADTVQEATSNPLLKNDCVPLRIPGTSLTTPICIYDTREDRWVSGSLRGFGSWEWEIMVKMSTFLTPATVLLDVGCNIGVFTLMAAKLGHRVVSVDPFKKNLFLLARSLTLGHLQGNVTLINNAIGDKVEKISLQEEKGNVGGTQVIPIPSEGTIEEDYTAWAVTLDHLTPLLANQTVVMKMDIESYEWNALKSGYTFFRNVRVKCIFMEWTFHRVNSVSALGIINFMTTFNFEPFSVQNQRLDIGAFTNWPGDILWLSKSMSKI